MAVVMLVDDDPDTRALLKKFLESLGHRATCAAHGKEALGVMGGDPADVVILDAVMPEMDGVQFLEVLRCYLRWQQTPVVMLTAHAEGPHIRRAAELGVKKTFLKADYDLEELGAYVNALSAGGPPEPL
jgi:CheY-like chemotaxis protein